MSCLYRPPPGPITRVDDISCTLQAVQAAIPWAIITSVVVFICLLILAATFSSNDRYPGDKDAYFTAYCSAYSASNAGSMGGEERECTR